MQQPINQKLSVGIVIPAHNEAEHLRSCLDAIALQTVKPANVVVVDNNSSDETATIATSYDFVKLVTCDQQGIVYARTAGYDAVETDIIGRIDADVALPPDWVKHIQEFYADPAHTRMAWTGHGNFYNVRFAKWVNLTYSLYAFYLNKLLTGQPTLWGSNMAMTNTQWRAVRDKVHMRNDIHEDLDLTIHLNHAGYSVHYDSKNIVHAELRRVNTDQDKLWGYLQWWPRTLRIHGMKTWLLCWLFTVLPLYIGAKMVSQNKSSGS